MLKILGAGHRNLAKCVLRLDEEYNANEEHYANATIKVLVDSRWLLAQLQAQVLAQVLGLIERDVGQIGRN